MPELMDLTLDERIKVTQIIKKIMAPNTTMNYTRKGRRAKKIISKEALDQEMDDYWQKKKWNCIDINSKLLLQTIEMNYTS